MRHLRAWMLRLAGLFRKDQRERDFNEEIESHLAMHVEDNMRAGMTPDEARRAAILKLGGMEPTRQAYRDRGTIPFLEDLLQDLRYALRQLRRNPGFAFTAVLILAVGIGASVAIFGFVDAALIRPLPYGEPARLVDVNESNAQFPRSNLSYLDYLDWKKLNTVLELMEAYGNRGYIFTTSAGSEMVTGARVSDGFFRTLGVAPLIGRDFYSGEDLPEAPNTVMLTYASWQKRFGGRSDVIGQTITLNGNAHTIVGVLPRNFQFAPIGNAEFWSTLHASGGCDQRRSCHNLYGVGRIKRGVTIDAARADMTLIAGQLESQYPDSNRGQGASVMPLSEVIIGDVRPILLVLSGGAGLLLLIACVNVSSLLLVRSESRKRELSIRRALGASTSRLIRQFATEALVLALIGSAIGLAVSHWAMQLLVKLIPQDMLGGLPFLTDLGLNTRLLVCAALLTLFIAVLFAIAPALRLPSVQIREGVEEGGRGSAGTTWRSLGAKLVVLELAIAVVLLVGAGLLVKSFYRLLQVDLGFEPDGVATLSIAAPQATYGEDEQAAALGRQLVSRVAALPGVKSAAITSALPARFNGGTMWIRFVGKPYNGEHNEVNMREVSPDYFKTLQAQLLQGRYFTESDDATKPSVVIINQVLAKRYFAGEDPIGMKLGDTSLSPKSIAEVVGVIDDIREGTLDSEIWPAIYYPFSQSPETYYSLVVRTSQDAQSVFPMLRDAIREIDPGVAIIGEATMNDRIGRSQTVYLRRSSAWLVASFAALALLLGVVGLYGVIAYSVSRRTREIGVRIALGAQRRSLYQMILSEAGALVTFGILMGLACAVGAATLMQKVLFGTPPWDVQTLLAVALVLAGAALLASFIPARRAATVDPVEALRAE